MSGVGQSRPFGNVYSNVRFARKRTWLRLAISHPDASSKVRREDRALYPRC
jgi:hypothetical protein